MDGDPAVEPEVDSFSLALPLPYRVAIITVLGIWAWGLNLHYLHLLKIVRLPHMKKLVLTEYARTFPRLYDTLLVQARILSFITIRRTD